MCERVKVRFVRAVIELVVCCWKPGALYDGKPSETRTRMIDSSAVYDLGKGHRGCGAAR